MRYASAAAFRQALEARLVALSRDGGLSLVRLRKSVAFDRLLARLFAVAPDRWVLKGGLALDYRLGAKARTTMDVDLAGAGDEDAATADLLAVPGALPRPPADWRVPYARMALDVGLPAEFDRGYELVARLLDPVLSGEIGAADWEPAARRWAAPSSQASN